jgi:phosphoribosylformylglycinamidine cyclo-ligase
MPGATYLDAGVDLSGAAAIKERIMGLCASTHGSRVVDMAGFFAGAYEFPAGSDSLLVVSTDSVGTKVRLAVAADRLEGLGHDLVGHCVNDILTTGAEPLLFLDYIGIGEVDDGAIGRVVSGLAEACQAAGCALIGGETAILADVYGKGDFDLVGFVVGTVTRDRLLAPGAVREGDVLIGLPSSGLHSNGYSLARKVFGTDDDPSVLDERPVGLTGTLGEALLEPHRSYLGALRPVLGEIRGMSHITGGGMTENLPRVLPGGLAANVELTSWSVPPLFRLIQRRGNVADDEMMRVFNMGVGMVLIADPARVDGVLAQVAGSWRLGSVVRSGVISGVRSGTSDGERVVYR